MECAGGDQREIGKGRLSMNFMTDLGGLNQGDQG
jgi:hypothetical protein